MAKIPNFGEGVVAQPPPASDVIYERIPHSQLLDLYRQINTLRGVLMAIREFCYKQRREQVEQGLAEHEPMVQAVPIIAIIKETLKD